jgi:hypothetical protein
MQAKLSASFHDDCSRGDSEKFPQADVPREQLVDIRPRVKPSELFRSVVKLSGLAAKDLSGTLVTLNGQRRILFTQIEEPTGRFRILVGDRGSLARVNLAQPVLLPEESAFGLATAVGRAITPEIVEKYRFWKLPAPGQVACVTYFFGAGRDGELLAAVLKHLRHERQLIELSPVIESAKDFLGALDLHNVTTPRCCPTHSFHPRDANRRRIRQSPAATAASDAIIREHATTCDVTMAVEREGGVGAGLSGGYGCTVPCAAHCVSRNKRSLVSTRYFRRSLPWRSSVV